MPKRTKKERIKELEARVRELEKPACQCRGHCGGHCYNGWHVHYYPLTTYSSSVYAINTDTSGNTWGTNAIS
jgi:hypothetical protein